MRQLQALSLLLDGRSVFLTGPPGSGKSYVVRQFVNAARGQGKQVAVTASTGIAASHIGGSTLHSWSGIGIRQELTPRDLRILSGRSQLLKRFNGTDILIIDEVSMLHGNLLNMLDELARTIRENDQPFGGMQIILVGDLYQLPPINRTGTPDDFIHLSVAWQSLTPAVCYLHEQHRQQSGELLDLLEGLRAQRLMRRHIDLLQKRLDAACPPDASITRLFTHNVNVDELNQKQLNLLPGETRTFYMEATGKKTAREQLAKSVLAPEELDLKIGSEVMFVANDPARKFANGTRGKVIEFDSKTNAPMVQLYDRKKVITVTPYTWQMHEDGKIRAEVAQLPLRLAWAITVHKSQGMSLDAAQIDLSKAFTPGMGYVALSRVRSAEGLYLSGLNREALRLHPIIHAFDAAARADSDTFAKNTPDANLEIYKKQVSSTHTDEKLLGELKSWRLDLSRAKALPPYVIAHDKLLEDISIRMPGTNTQLAAVPGIGPAKLKNYGPDILAIVARHK